MHATHTTAIREAFDANSSHYDEERRSLIPCFDEFYGTAVRCAQELAGPHPRVLELGVGTGLFTAMLSNALPGASFTLVDLSEAMLAKARVRFAGRDEFRFVSANYAAPDFALSVGDGYDRVVSALSIHHLEDADKVQLFRTVRSLLRPGGGFVNADQAAGSSDWFERRFEAWWLADVQATDLSEESVAASRRRRQLDRNAPVCFQLEGLRAAGFANSDVAYRNGVFAVFAAC